VRAVPALALVSALTAGKFYPGDGRLTPASAQPVQASECKRGNSSNLDRSQWLWRDQPRRILPPLPRPDRALDSLSNHASSIGDKQWHTTKQP
jgi:hypothetical protein